MVQVTKILRAGQGGSVLVQTLQGLPFGAPVIGTVINIPGFGLASCSGHEKSGSGKNETIDAVSFTLK